MIKTWQKIRNQPEKLQTYLVREQVIDQIRAFFKKNGFNEVETPLLVRSPGTEPYLDVFATQIEVVDGRKMAGYLLTSPEFAMKKLLVAGLSNIFQICKSFRNGEGIGPTHNHEFTILEWYRANADYTHIMNDCENLVLQLAKVFRNNQDLSTFNYQNRVYNLNPNWPRLTVAKLFELHTGATKDQLTTDALIEVARQHQLQADNWDDAFNLLFANYIEPELQKMNQPVFVYDYPIQQAALAKRKLDDVRFAERFELYFGGIELANAFSELTDADEQKKRFLSELAIRAELGKTAYQLDQDFIDALEIGMPESGGVALGVDRLIMLMADVPSIKDTLFFPVEEVFSL